MNEFESIDQLPDAEFIERMRVYAIDHEPEGWPAVKMKHITRLCDLAALSSVDGEADPVAWRISYRIEGGMVRRIVSGHNSIADYRHIDPEAYSEPLYLATPSVQKLQEEVERLKNPNNWWCPEVCPITGLPFFMWITHHKTNEWVPTYGGPYDSYTIPVKDAEGDYIRERYDHDRGGWLVDEVEDVGVQIVDSQLYTSEDDPEEIRQQLAQPAGNVGDEREAFEAWWDEFTKDRIAAHGDWPRIKQSAWEGWRAARGIPKAKLSFTKEWCINMAKQDDGEECSAVAPELLSAPVVKAEQLAAGQVAKAWNLEAEIHKVAKRFLSPKKQGYFMGAIRAMLSAAPEQAESGEGKNV